MRIGKPAFALALRCLPILLSGVIVFPVFVTTLDESTIRYHLGCHHQMHGAAVSPSGRYKAVVVSYACPTLFYPTNTVVVRLHDEGSLLPNLLNSTEVYWFDGYRSKVRANDVARWASDTELVIGGPSPEEIHQRNKNYPARWRDVAISHQN
jgi:hypothetical protein